MCGIAVTQILATELGRSHEEVGAYRIRAPLKPVPIAAIATLAQGTEPKTEETHDSH
jgi:hypothetical protein